MDILKKTFMVLSTTVAHHFCSGKSGIAVFCGHEILKSCCEILTATELMEKPSMPSCFFSVTSMYFWDAGLGDDFCIIMTEEEIM